MIVTLPQLKTFAPSIPASSLDDALSNLNSCLDQFGINTGRRIRYFMAQSFHETNGYSKWEEDLNYTHADRLVAVYPTHFSMARNDPKKAYAPDFVRNPQKVANEVYDSRYGNGNAASGDGWKFRGRGAFNLTFQANYAKASTAIYNDDRLLSNPDQVATDWCARWRTAGWFWSVNKFNLLADADQFTRVSTIIQGSDDTVQERLVILNKANTIFLG